ncbi:hypothetical protein [Mangrovicella endophytica]|uniref:hypothetical protein n=1 Tax=Mangrovicella endophytica TaxID=2066697 RepID=UPI000C9DDE39|nr:hypothetical protein [Mangrovicella endophytica]
MAEHMLKEWEREATAMRRRDLTSDEKNALSEEMLKGTLSPETAKRARKNIIRSAIDKVRPGRKTRAG